jgi:hypothetical protein
MDEVKKPRIRVSSAKAKGRRLQQWVAKRIQALFNLSEKDVVSASGGVSGIDVQLAEHARSVFAYGVECKSYANIAIYKWWAQCQSNAHKEGLQPLMVVKGDRKDPLVVMSWDTFESLISTPEKSN